MAGVAADLAVSRKNDKSLVKCARATYMLSSAKALGTALNLSGEKVGNLSLLSRLASMGRKDVIHVIR